MTELAFHAHARCGLAYVVMIAQDTCTSDRAAIAQTKKFLKKEEEEKEKEKEKEETRTLLLRLLCLSRPQSKKGVTEFLIQKYRERCLDSSRIVLFWACQMSND